MEGRYESNHGRDEVYLATFENEEETGLKLDDDEVSISSECGSPTLIFKLWESFFNYQTMLFALEELENGYRSLKIEVGEPNTVPKV